jgi:hypothetical protein
MEMRHKMERLSRKDEAEVAATLKKLLGRGDLIESSKYLPADHPIRPALKRAIGQKRRGGRGIKKATMTIDEAREGLKALSLANKLMGDIEERNMQIALIPLRRVCLATITQAKKGTEVGR